MKHLLLLLVLAPALHAQTISPVVSEAKGPRVRGEVTVTNNQLIPMAVQIQPYLMAIDNGKPSFLPTNAATVVHLDSNSARLGPKQTYAFGFDFRCAELPCVVSFDVVFTGLHTRDGLAVALHGNSIYYVCDKEKACRQHVRASWGLM